MTTSIEGLVTSLLGADPPVRVRAFDGTDVGPSDAATTILIRSPDALRRILFAPNEIGFARAYAVGDLDVEGDLTGLFGLRDRLPRLQLTPTDVVAVARSFPLRELRPLPPPPEEVRLRGRLHSRRRDASAVSHHYDLSNAFYSLVLGPSMSYSCAVFEDVNDTLEQAQANKHELVYRKLGTASAMRVLDVGCGWGSAALHAATRFGASVVAVTISEAQAEDASKRVAEAGLDGQVTVRCQDWRDVTDGPFDAISSIGMFEHVGRHNVDQYLEHLHGLLAPGGRLLLHTMGRPPFRRPLIERPQFITRYVFPDGDLHQIGSTVDAVQHAGFEVLHLESLRNHYGPTLELWRANLERHWEAAVADVGTARARIWRLYLAGCAANFTAGNMYVHQILAARRDGPSNGYGLRPTWERTPLATAARDRPG